MRVLRSRGTELERDFAFGVVRQLFEPPLVEASELERADLLQARCRRCGRPARAHRRTRGTERALPGRRPLVRDPARPLLAVREPGCSGTALPAGRRRAPGRRPVPALSGFPAHAARRAERRARRGDPSSRNRYRRRAAHDPDDRSLRRCDPSSSSDESGSRPARGGEARRASDPAVVDTCLRVTRGMPFLVHELVEALSEEGIAQPLYKRSVAQPSSGSVVCRGMPGSWHERWRFSSRATCSTRRDSRASKSSRQPMQPICWRPRGSSSTADR